MIIAPYLLAVTAAATPYQGPSLDTVSQFVEQLVNHEVTLQLDRRDVVASKASKGSLKKLMDDAALTRSLIQNFEDQVLTGLSEPVPSAIAHLRTSLSDYKVSLDGPKLIPTKSLDNGAEPCCDHDVTYIKAVGAMLRYPGFSPSASLSGATYYNTSPLLYEKKHGPIYADPLHPTEARILPRCIRRGSALRTGDVIVGLRRGDDEEWEEVNSWKDVLKASHEFGRENRILVKVRRGKSTKDLKLSTTTVAVES